MYVKFSQLFKIIMVFFLCISCATSPVEEQQKNNYFQLTKADAINYPYYFYNDKAMDRLFMKVGNRLTSFPSYIGQNKDLGVEFKSSTEFKTSICGSQKSLIRKFRGLLPKLQSGIPVDRAQKIFEDILLQYGILARAYFKISSNEPLIHQKVSDLQDYMAENNVSINYLFVNSNMELVKDKLSSNPLKIIDSVIGELHDNVVEFHWNSESEKGFDSNYLNYVYLVDQSDTDSIVYLTPSIPVFNTSIASNRPVYELSKRITPLRREQL